MSFGGFPLGGKGLGGTSSSSNESLTPEQQQMQMVKTVSILVPTYLIAPPLTPTANRFKPAWNPAPSKL